MDSAVTPSDIAESPEERALKVREDVFEAARRYAGKSRAENTWRGYRSAWSRFDDWCQQAQLAALPASPATVAMFIAAEADAGLANATLEHRLAAIRMVHLGAGHPSPHNTLAVLEVLRGIRRDRRATALSPTAGRTCRGCPAAVHGRHADHRRSAGFT